MRCGFSLRLLECNKPPKSRVTFLQAAGVQDGQAGGLSDRFKHFSDQRPMSFGCRSMNIDASTSSR